MGLLIYIGSPTAFTIPSSCLTSMLTGCQKLWYRTVEMLMLPLATLQGGAPGVW